MNKWHAIDAVEESFEATKNILFKPFKIGFWMKLALVFYLIGAGGTNINVNQDWESFDEIGKTIVFDQQTIILIAVIVAAILFIMLALTYISSVMRFTTIRALISGKISIMADFKKDAENGLKIFYVYLAVFAINLGLILAGILAYIKLSPATNPLMMLPAIFIAIVFLIFWFLAQAIFMYAVTEFTIPIMYAKNQSFIQCLKHTWKLVKENPWQFMMYLVISIAVGIVGAIISMIIMIPVIIVFVVFALAALFIVGFMMGFSGMEMQGPGMALILAVGIPAAMAVIIFFGYTLTLLTLPVHVFYRYMALSYLSKLDKKLKLFKKAKIKKIKKKGKKTVKVY